MMRALALLLLLVNLGYHLWSVQRPPPAGAPPPPEPLPPGAERLRLLSERREAPAPASPPAAGPAAEPTGTRSDAGPDPETRPEAAPPAEPADAPEPASAVPGAAPAPAGRRPDPAATVAPPAPHCERIGPLEPELAGRVVAALRRAGGRAELLPEPVPAAPAAIQLYVPAPASFAEAREIVRALGEAGLEAYVMGREELSGAVSVGLFTEPARARDRRARVEALGYEVAERAPGSPARRVRVAVRLPGPAVGRVLAGLDADPEAFPRESVVCGAEEGEPARDPPDS